MFKNMVPDKHQKANIYIYIAKKSGKNNWKCPLLIAPERKGKKVEPVFQISGHFVLSPSFMYKKLI